MASQPNFSFPPPGLSSPENYLSGQASLQGNLRQLGGSDMNREQNPSHASIQSAATTNSWGSQLTYGSSAPTDSFPNSQDIPNFKFEDSFDADMSYDTITLDTNYQNHYCQSSPLTEQTNALDGLSLDYTAGNSPGTEQANFPLMGQHFPAQSQRFASDEKSTSYQSEYWAQPSPRSSEHLNTVYSQSFQGLVNQHSYSSEHPEQRHTPNSLGWVHNSDLLKKYRLMIRKGKEPFLQLESQADVTADTPVKVYFDPSPSTQKNEYFCLWPGDCDRKRRAFGRPADLDRHLKNVHADPSQKDSFPCDYEKCSSGRHSEPFTRKDHYRDHLRDFHKEDIGAAKGEKSAKTEKEKAKWKKDQKNWLAERRIYADSWRCVKCLVKKSVRAHGWECDTCKTPCEQDRIDARLKLPQKAEAMHMDDELQYQSRLPQKVISQAMYVDSQPQYQSYTTTCQTCIGSLWVLDTDGQWVACVTCSS